jgi:hypothetical protein
VTYDIKCVLLVEVTAQLNRGLVVPLRAILWGWPLEDIHVVSVVHVLDVLISAVDVPYRMGVEEQRVGHLT